MTSISGATTAVSALLQAKLHDSQPFQELALFMHERYVEYLLSCMNGSLDMMKLVDSWHEIGEKYENKIKQQLAGDKNNENTETLILKNVENTDFDKLLDKITSGNKSNEDFQTLDNHEDFGLISKRENIEIDENLKIESDEELENTELDKNSELDILSQLFESKSTNDGLNLPKNSSKYPKKSRTFQSKLNQLPSNQHSSQHSSQHPSQQFTSEMPTLLNTSYNTSNNPNNKPANHTKIIQNPDKFSPKISHFETSNRQKVEECPICHKFTKNINRHMKTHSNERPFTCDFCDVSYKFKQSMMRHLQTKHGDIKRKDPERYHRSYQEISNMRQYSTNLCLQKPYD